MPKLSIRRRLIASVFATQLILTIALVALATYFTRGQLRAAFDAALHGRAGDGNFRAMAPSRRDGESTFARRMNVSTRRSRSGRGRSSCGMLPTQDTRRGAPLACGEDL